MKRKIILLRTIFMDLPVVLLYWQKRFGYEPVVVCGKVPGGRDGSPDGYTRHCWAMINGRHYHSEAQYAGWGKGIYGYGNYPISHRIQKIVKF